jgi:hypothetical protein
MVLYMHVHVQAKSNYICNVAYKKDGSFVGRDAVAISDLAEAIMIVEILIPPDQRAEDSCSDNRKEYEHAVRC